ncbi:MAG: class I SAM-dependent methyltransferase [Acidimicrobiales bacterium]|jgi:hypothetical protein
MQYLDFLDRFHALLRPRTYLEVGIRNGASLALSRCASIGIDPAYELTTEINAPHELFEMTSDDYFASLGSRTPFSSLPIDLAFIDGMHLFEFALRDFINVERYCAPSSVVVFDDMLPRDVDEAARERHTQAWTGDVFKLRDVLVALRPDLRLTVVDTEPTGLLIVSNLSPTNAVLAQRFEEIVAAYVKPDPQRIAPEVLTRSIAVGPLDALSMREWTRIRSKRTRQRLLRFA